MDERHDGSRGAPEAGRTGADPAGGVAQAPSEPGGDRSSHQLDEHPGDDSAATVEDRRPSRRLLWALAVVLFTGLVLSAHAPLFELRRLHVQPPFIDQAGYITTARRLLEHGEFRPGIVFPAYAENHHYRPYMPGHYLTLATSYGLLGWGVLPTLLPSLLGHVLVTLCAFLIGERLYGRRQGLLAAGLTAFFSPLVTYAFTAMAELTFTAAAMVVMAAFVHLPSRARPWAAAPLLALPFIFRETGALFLLPMAWLVVSTGRGLEWRKVVAMGLASVALCVALQQWQIADGKGVLPMGRRVVEGNFNYGDAYPGPAPELSPWGWVLALRDNFLRNVEESKASMWAFPDELRTRGFVAIAAISLASLVLGALRGKRDRLLLGAGSLGVLTILLLVTVYDTKNERAMRSTMFVAPLNFVALAGALYPHRIAEHWRSATGLARALVATVIVLVAGSYLAINIDTTRLAAHRLVSQDSKSRVYRNLIAQLHGEDLSMLIAPPSLAADFLVHQFPTLGSSLPYNDETLRLLVREYEVGSLVLPFEWLNRNISTQALEELGFRLLETKGRFLFYRTRSG